MSPPRVLCEEFYQWAEPHKLSYLATRRNGDHADASKWLNNTFKTAFLAMPFSNPADTLNLCEKGTRRLKETTAEDVFKKRVSTFFREAWKQAEKDLKASESKAAEEKKRRIRAASAVELFASQTVVEVGERVRTLTASRLEKYSSQEEKAKHRLSVRAEVLAEIFEALSDDEKEGWIAKADQEKERLNAQRVSVEEVARKQRELKDVLTQALNKHVGSHQLGTMAVYTMGMYKDAATGMPQFFKVQIESGGTENSNWFDDEAWRTTVYPLFVEYTSNSLNLVEEEDDGAEPSSALNEGGKHGKSSQKKAGASTTSALTKSGASVKTAVPKETALPAQSDDESDEEEAGGRAKARASGGQRDEDDDSEDGLDATPGRLYFFDNDENTAARNSLTPSPSPSPSPPPAKKPVQLGGRGKEAAAADGHGQHYQSSPPSSPPRAPVKKAAQGGRGKKAVASDDHDEESHLSPPPQAKASGKTGSLNGQGSSGDATGAGASGTAATSGKGLKRAAPDRADEPAKRKRASVGDRELQSLGANAAGRHGRTRAAGGARRTRSKGKGK